MRLPLTVPVAALTTGIFLGVPAAPAPARVAADDISINVCLSTAQGGCQIAARTDPTFKLGVEVSSSSGVPQMITVSIGLPEGLRWGSDLPDPSEGCTGTAPAVCTSGLDLNPAGSVGGGWVWDVVAERSGLFEITAIVDPSEPDSDTSNNSHTLRLEVEQPPSDDGGVTEVSASAVLLTPSRPKAGKPFIASVNVRAGGTAVRPSSVACAGSVGTRKIAGKASASSGKASCRYTPPRNAKGRVLRGLVSFTARGQRFTKRFAAKLG